MRKHKVSVAMKPYKTLKGVLIHPKDKQDKEDVTGCVYKVPCANCDKTYMYIGETGRKFGVRLQEHRTEVESKTRRTFTRSHRASSLTEHNKSLSRTTQLKRTMSLTGPKRRWSTESQSVLPDGSRRPYTSGRTTGHEPWWGQLPTEQRIRPLSWHGIFPSCQESEELSTSFFWGRPLTEVEMSSFFR